MLLSTLHQRRVVQMAPNEQELLDGFGVMEAMHRRKIVNWMLMVSTSTSTHACMHPLCRCCIASADAAMLSHSPHTHCCLPPMQVLRRRANGEAGGMTPRTKVPL